MTVDPKVQAMLNKNKENAGKPIYFTPQVSVPGSDIVNEKKVALTNSTSLLSIYIVAIFKYSIGIIGIIAAIVLMFAGMRWLTAGGSSSAIGDARKLIAGSLTGLLLALVSFLLLTTINTKLTDLTAVDIKPIQKIDLTLEGCCEKQNPDGSWTSENISDKDCQDLKKKGFLNTKFSYGLKADANKCSVDTRKKACCLYDKNKGGLYEGCYSNNLPLPESIIDFTNTCKEKINKDEKTYPDKWVHDDYQIQQIATCDCAQSGFCKCVDPK